MNGSVKRLCGRELARRFRLLPVAGIALALLAVMVVLSGCVIQDINLNSNQPAGSAQEIVINLKMFSDVTKPSRPTFAIRIPEAWNVTSVEFSGAVAGAVTSSPVIADYFATVWESKSDVTHNGPKEGYKWWAGYGPRGTWHTNDPAAVTVHINTGGRGGTYYLDFVLGITDGDSPASEVDEGRIWWEIGCHNESEPVSPGAKLDQEITLYCFKDVVPGHDFYDAIQGLGSAGIIQGYGPDANGCFEFRGSNPVRRAQYAKFICNMLATAGIAGYQADEDMTPPASFTDLRPEGDNPTDLYPHEYVWTAYNHNVIKGYTDGSFRPYDPITRQHVITMTVRALLALDPCPLQSPPSGWNGVWGRDMLPEHAANARIAEFNLLLENIPPASGTGEMPRQEVAQIMWNALLLVAGPE